MELRHLRYFAMVAEERNVSRGARRLNVSQPAVSKQLKDLEQELGVALFTRQHTGLRLTPAGQTFLAHATEILHRAAVAIEAVQSPVSKARHSIAVGYIPTAVPNFLGKALRRLRTTDSGLTIRLQGLSPQDQIRGLRDKTLDLALVGNPQPEWKREFATRILSRTPIAAVLPADHRLAQRKGFDLTELSAEDFVGLAEEHFPGRNECIRGACRRVGFAPRLSSFADSLAALIGLVGGGAGVALAPADAEAFPHPDVVFVRLRRPRVYAESVAAWRGPATSSMLSTIIEVLAACGKQTQSPGAVDEE